MNTRLLAASLLCWTCAATAQDQPPTRTKPFDHAAVEKQGVGTSATADNVTGELSGAVSVKASGYVTSIAGVVRPYVRWNYSFNGSEPVRAAVVAQYSLDCGAFDVYAGDPTCGSGYSDVRAGVRITDLSSDDNPVRYSIESKGTAQMVVPLNFAQSFKGQEIIVIFKPGHNYAIDVYLQVQAGVYSGESLGVQGTPGGQASASATMTVEAIRLLTMAKPWIRTSLTEIYSPVHDTYDRYEELFTAGTGGRHYGLAAAWVEVAAGGRYDTAQSHVVISGDPAPYVSVGTSGLQPTPSPTSVRLTLPDCYSLPLEGKTWRFIAYFDPEFQTPRDDLGVGPPMFRTAFETMFDAGQLQRAAALDSGLMPGTGIRLAADRAAAPLAKTTFQPRQFFDPGNWSVAMPAAWLVTPPGSRTAAKPNKLKVQLCVPPGQAAPPLDKAYLTVSTTKDLKLAVARPEFTTEPVVLVSIEELWKMLCKVQLPNGLQLCANPPFIQLVQRLADDAEAYRMFLDNLYLKAPNGQLYKVTDLDEDRPTLLLQGPGGTTPIWLPRRLRVFIRRAAALQQAAALFAESRPTQEHRIRVQGYVQNDAGQNGQSAHERAYHVVLDLVPRPQPWHLPEMTATLP